MSLLWTAQHPHTEVHTNTCILNYSKWSNRWMITNPSGRTAFAISASNTMNETQWEWIVGQLVHSRNWGNEMHIDHWWSCKDWETFDERQASMDTKVEFIKKYQCYVIFVYTVYSPALVFLFLSYIDVLKVIQMIKDVLPQGNSVPDTGPLRNLFCINYIQFYYIKGEIAVSGREWIIFTTYDYKIDFNQFDLIEMGVCRMISKITCVVLLRNNKVIQSI